MLLGPSKGQILWIEKMIQDPSINVSFNDDLCMCGMSRTAIEDNGKYTTIKRWLGTKLF